MQYSSPPNAPSLNYGREMEPKARHFYNKLMARDHETFSKELTGLHVSPQYPYLGASPDGVVSCSCHGECLLEIKCPYKYRTGLKNWQIDKNFPIDSSGEIETSHRYYTQVQGQMFILNKEYCDFFVWTPLETHENYLLLRVQKDDNFIKTMLPRLGYFFHAFLKKWLLVKMTFTLIINKNIIVYVKNHVLNQ